MEMKVTFQGVEATFTVADADAGIALLKKLASSGDSRTPTVATNANALVSQTPVRAETPEASVIADSVISAVLNSLKGSQGAKVLKLLSEAENGMNDTRLRESLGGKEASFGPVFAHISKVCKREGVTTAAIYSSINKRVAGGKLHYLYRINPQASRILKAIPNFETATAFEGF